MRRSWQFPFITTLIAGYLLAVWSNLLQWLLQATAPVQIPPSLLWLPGPSLCSLTSAASHINCSFSVRVGEEQQKYAKLKWVPQALPMIFIQVYEAKVSAWLSRAVTQVSPFTTALLPLLPEAAAAPRQVWKLHQATAQQLAVAGCQLEQHWQSWAPLDAGCQLPLPAAQGSLASRAAINKTSWQQGCRTRGYQSHLRMGSRLGGCCGREKEKATSWKMANSDFPPPTKAGDGLKDNYWSIIIPEQITSLDCQQYIYFFFFFF